MPRTESTSTKKDPSSIVGSNKRKRQAEISRWLVDTDTHLSRPRKKSKNSASLDVCGKSSAAPSAAGLSAAAAAFIPTTIATRGERKQEAAAATSSPLPTSNVVATSRVTTSRSTLGDLFPQKEVVRKAETIDLSNDDDSIQILSPPQKKAAAPTSLFDAGSTCPPQNTKPGKPRSQKKNPPGSRNHTSSRGNHCNQSNNGIAGILHLAGMEGLATSGNLTRRAEKSANELEEAEGEEAEKSANELEVADGEEEVAMDDNVASTDPTKDGEDGMAEEQEHTDFFAETDFRTNNTIHVKETEWRNTLQNKVEVTQAFMDRYAGSIVTHPIENRSDIQIKTNIVYWLLEQNHIETLASSSSSVNDPKHYRSSLDIIGSSQQLLNKQPQAYCIAKTKYGADTLKKLGAAIVDSDNKLGADGSKANVYSLCWNGVPKVTKGRVGADDNKTNDAAMVMGDHCDQNTKNDRLDYTARNVTTCGPDFNLDRTLCVVYLGEDGKEKVHKICTVSQQMDGNQSYYLSHWGSGRGAIAQTTFNGERALLVIMHRVWVPDKSKTCARGIIVSDSVFATKPDHDAYLEMVDPDKSNSLTPGFDAKMTELYNELLKAQPSFGEYFGNLGSKVSNTIKTNVPCASDFVVQCCNDGCGNNASVLNLQQIDGIDNGLSGAELHDHLQHDYDRKALADSRLLCENCSIDIPEALVVNKLCLKCYVKPKLFALSQCGGCGDYKCSGYLENGERKFECEQDGDHGVPINESNIGPIGVKGLSICKDCYLVKNRLQQRKQNAKESQRRKKKRDDEAGCDVGERWREEMLAIYQLKDQEQRNILPQRYYCNWGTPRAISWECVCDAKAKGGYGALAGQDIQRVKNLWKSFRRKGCVGENIDSLAKFEDYIKKKMETDGNFGRENMGVGGQEKKDGTKRAKNQKWTKEEEKLLTVLMQTHKKKGGNHRGKVDWDVVFQEYNAHQEYDDRTKKNLKDKAGRMQQSKKKKAEKEAMQQSKKKKV